MKKKEKLEKFISKIDLKKALGRLMQERHVVAPINACADVVFQEVQVVDDIVFDYENCLNAPRDYMLLNDELLFKFDLKKMQPIKDDVVFGQVVIFGSRACDTRAVGLLDKFFSRKFQDPVYFNKRNNIVIISLMCDKLAENCFCTSTHSGPYLKDNFDVQLTDIGQGYFVEADSFKGRELVKSLSDLMGEVDSNKRDQKQEAIEKSLNSKVKDFNLARVYDNLDKLSIRDQLWQDLAQRCQSCGGCLLICPACSCFYVVDKKINHKQGARYRSLDTCLYEGFTRMSGGYNPVNRRQIMMQRKFYHKLWQQLDEFGESGCTGCGRCNQICPGNVNWLKVIKRIENTSV